MATRESMRAIDEAHRLAQARTAAVAATVAARAWRQVDPQRISATSPAFVNTALAAIESSRRRSVDLAGAYAQRTRLEQDPGLPRLTLPPPPPFNVEQVRASLTYLGPVSAGRQVASGLAVPTVEEDDDLEVPPARATPKTVDRIMERAAIQIVGAAIRHVQNGGRFMVDAVVESDQKAVGYIRITRDNPCSFCAMLASRGPVYKESSFSRSDPRFDGPGNHKVHDSCGCTIRPLYSKSRFAMPENNQKYLELYETATRGYRGKDAQNAFRRAFERPSLHLGDPEDL